MLRHRYGVKIDKNTEAAIRLAVTFLSLLGETLVDPQGSGKRVAPFVLPAERKYEKTNFTTANNSNGF